MGASPKPKIRLEKRMGKMVTVIAGLHTYGDQRLNEIAKELKTSLGAGGTVKNGAIEIQGDKADAIKQWFARVLTFAILFLWPAPAFATIEISQSPAYPGFDESVRSAIERIETHVNPVFGSVISTLKQAPVQITLSAIGDDPASIHPDGDPSRWHTDPVDGLPKRLGRDKPTGSVVYVNAKKFLKGNADDVLVHELMHAYDLATGRYHPSAEIRERRAVFMQNLWRDTIGRKLRSDYHGNFETLDYQHSKRDGTLDGALNDLLNSDPDRLMAKKTNGE